jgi:hypothetical protein
MPFLPVLGMYFPFVTFLSMTGAIFALLLHQAREFRAFAILPSKKASSA